MKILDFLDNSNKIEIDFVSSQSRIMEVFDEWDLQLRAYTRFSSDEEASLLILNTHALFLSAAKTSISGQTFSTYLLLRAAFESAAYASMILSNPDLGEVWRKRHKNEESFKDNKTAFAPAMRRVWELLDKYDQDLKPNHDTGYKPLLRGNYEALIDYGAHPNPKSILNNQIITGGVRALSKNYLNNGNSEMVRAIIACFDIAISICIILHATIFYRDFGVTPTLENKFLPLFNMNNEIADFLNGQPIGFFNRHYSKIDGVDV